MTKSALSKPPPVPGRGPGSLRKRVLRKPPTITRAPQPKNVTAKPVTAKPVARERATEEMDLDRVRALLDSPGDKSSSDGAKATETMDMTSLRQLLDATREGAMFDLNSIPVLQVSPGQIRWHELDPTSAYVLSRIDGHRSYRDILSESADSKEVVAHWIAKGVIANVPATK